MAGVKRFQDLDCWKLARMARREVVRLTRREPVCRDFKFVNQIRDAARGGTRNIAEGWSRFGPKEIIYFLGIAKSSLDETEDEMVDGLESGYWSQREYAVVRSWLRRSHGAIRGWWRYLESPTAARFYEEHRAKIEREIKLGLRRPPKDPSLRPWRRTDKPDRVKPFGLENLEPANPEPANPEPANLEPANLKNPRT
jgi:four helix bundle protein